MATELSKSGCAQWAIEETSLFFSCSAFMFRLGLAFETFEIIRPLGVLIGDYFFFASLLLLLCSKRRRLLKSTGSGLLAAAVPILLGVLLSLLSTSSPSAADSAARFFTLFGLFAPLAVVHSKDIRRNMHFLIGGVSANCFIAILSAVVSSDIPEALAIAPQVDTYSGQAIGRFGGLAGHSNLLGLSAALAILIAVGLLLSEKKTYVRRALVLQILICTFGAFLSGSRTFLVSLVPALVVLMPWRKLNARMIGRICLSFVAVFAVWATVDRLVPDLTPQYKERLAATSADDTENYGRLLTAGLALVEISQKPILGWGIEKFGEAGMMFLPADRDFMPAHVSFLHYWYAEGLLGAIGFLMLFVLPVWKMLRALKKNPYDSSVNALRLGLSVYLLLFIASNLHPILFNRFLYMPLFVFAGLASSLPGAVSVGNRSRPPVMALSAPNYRPVPDHSNASESGC
jgi:O-antigen ligase